MNRDFHVRKYAAKQPYLVCTETSTQRRYFVRTLNGVAGYSIALEDSNSNLRELRAGPLRRHLESIAQARLG